MRRGPHRMDLFNGSPLGKIEIRGLDAAEFGFGPYYDHS